jgi:glycosyltransferase A (GT-A) superfamily protein (DUF2064 family)
MLSDVLESLSTIKGNVDKILLYAPHDGLSQMQAILIELDLKDWKLLPMKSTDLQGSHLGDILTDALVRARSFRAAPVVFLGMDSPEVPIDQVQLALSKPQEALLCPAADGGYGLLSLPLSAPANAVFQNVKWSHAQTAQTQQEALTRAQVPVTVGSLMHDIDEPHDLEELCQRLVGKENGCRHSRKVLVELGLL